MATKLLKVIFVAVITFFNYSKPVYSDLYFVDPPEAPLIEWSEIEGNWTFVDTKNSMPSTIMDFVIDENDEKFGKVIITNILPNGTIIVSNGEIDLIQSVIKFNRHYVANEDMMYYTTYIPIKVEPDSYIVFVAYICPEHAAKGSSGTGAPLLFSDVYRNDREIQNHYDEVHKFQKEFASKYRPGVLINC